VTPTVKQDTDEDRVDRVRTVVTAWLERAVIGLNLCPFAKAVHAKGQIRYAVCESTESADLLEALKFELQTLVSADPVSIDTTLLIAPNCLSDFLDFNDFLAQANRVVRKAGLEGEIQIASFHPRFEFADAPPGHISHYTNRAPYPILHLLREASIDRAVAAFPEPDMIFETNKRTLEQLGHSGWAALSWVSDEKPAP
jgi:uncharacterized protein